MHHFRTYLRLYQGAVLMALLIFTFRLYVSPSGAPDIHSWFREPAEQFFRRIGFDELMWNFNIALAGLGILNILVGALLIKRISAKAYFDGCIFSLLAFTLPLSHFGYAMAHSESKRVFAYALGWFLTVVLWVVYSIPRVWHGLGRPLNKSKSIS